MFSTSHTEDFVKEMYTAIGIIKPSQLNFKFISTKLGLNVYYWEEPSQALFLKDYPYIFLNELLTDQQQWQDYCHELGHVLQHVGKQHQMAHSFRQYQENKANHFMYHACIPTFMLKEIEPSELSIEYVARTFNVEYEFARVRLDQYISKIHMTKWNVQT